MKCCFIRNLVGRIISHAFSFGPCSTPTTHLHVFDSLTGHASDQCDKEGSNTVRILKKSTNSTGVPIRCAEDSVGTLTSLTTPGQTNLLVSNDVRDEFTLSNKCEFAGVKTRNFLVKWYPRPNCIRFKRYYGMGHGIDFDEAAVKKLKEGHTFADAHRSYGAVVDLTAEPTDAHDNKSDRIGMYIVVVALVNSVHVRNIASARDNRFSKRLRGELDRRSLRSMYSVAVRDTSEPAMLVVLFATGPVCDNTSQIRLSGKERLIAVEKKSVVKAASKQVRVEKQEVQDAQHALKVRSRRPNHHP